MWMPDMICGHPLGHCRSSERRRWTAVFCVCAPNIPDTPRAHKSVFALSPHCFAILSCVLLLVHLTTCAAIQPWLFGAFRVHATIWGPPPLTQWSDMLYCLVDVRAMILATNSLFTKPNAKPMLPNAPHLARIFYSLQRSLKLVLPLLRACSTFCCVLAQVCTWRKKPCSKG